MNKNTENTGLNISVKSFVTALAVIFGLMVLSYVLTFIIPGGEYGTLILSKYPIIKSEVTPLESSTHEARALGHAQINVDGEVIDFFNTHLSFEETSVRKGQLEAIANILKNHESFILTGDFNTADFAELAVLGGTLVNRSDRKFNTFPSEKVGGEIDNIVFSSTFAEKDEIATMITDYNERVEEEGEIRFPVPENARGITLNGYGASTRKDGDVLTVDEVQQFVDERDIRFSLAFGPILVDNYEVVPHTWYGVGEINEGYARSGLLQMDTLHYIVVTANTTGVYQQIPTVEQFRNKHREDSISLMVLVKYFEKTGQNIH